MDYHLKLRPFPGYETLLEKHQAFCPAEMGMHRSQQEISVQTNFRCFLEETITKILIWATCPVQHSTFASGSDFNVIPYLASIQNSEKIIKDSIIFKMQVFNFQLQTKYHTQLHYGFLNQP